MLGSIRSGTIVLAGAPGIGKSVMAAQAVQELTSRVCWVPFSNLPVELASIVDAALRQLEAESGGTSDHFEDSFAWTRALVLDDLDVAAGPQAVSEAVSLLHAEMGNTGVVLITTRCDVSAQLAVLSPDLIVDSRDLAMNAEEVLALADLLGLNPPSAALVGQLLQMSRGHAATISVMMRHIETSESDLLAERGPALDLSAHLLSMASVLSAEERIALYVLALLGSCTENEMVRVLGRPVRRLVQRLLHSLPLIHVDTRSQCTGAG